MRNSRLVRHLSADMELNLPAMEISNHSSEEATVIEVTEVTEVTAEVMVIGPIPTEAQVATATVMVVTTIHQHPRIQAQRLLQLQVQPVKMPMPSMLLNMQHTMVQVPIHTPLMVDTKPTLSTINNTWLHLRLSKLLQMQALLLHPQVRQPHPHLLLVDLQEQAVTMLSHHLQESDWISVHSFTLAWDFTGVGRSKRRIPLFSLCTYQWVASLSSASARWK